MSSIINLKKEILKVVLDSNGDLEKMNIYNIVKLSEEVKLYLKKEFLKEETFKMLTKLYEKQKESKVEKDSNDANLGSIFDKAIDKAVTNASENEKKEFIEKTNSYKSNSSNLLVDTMEKLEEDIECVDLKKNNLDNLSVFEEESDTIFQRMKQAHEKRELDDMKYKEYIKQMIEDRNNAIDMESKKSAKESESDVIFQRMKKAREQFNSSNSNEISEHITINNFSVL